MPVVVIDNHSKAPGRPGAFSHAAGDAPALILRIRPNRSLPRRGFVLFMALTCGMAAIPLLSILGTPVLWGVLPFAVLAISGLWIALSRNYDDGALTEELRLWSDHLALVRHNPRGRAQHWQTNPHWVRIELHKTGRPVENYLTLRGGGRAVELGAFLSPQERTRLCDALNEALARVR